MKKNVIKILCAMLIALSFTTATNITAYAESTKVYVGGCPIGIELQIDGVLVVGGVEVLTENGTYNAIKESDIEKGDIIKTVNSVKINSMNVFTACIENAENDIDVDIDRGGNIVSTKLKIVNEHSSDKHKVGLMVRGNIEGVGTLTFVREDGKFGALGHPAQVCHDKYVTPIAGGSTSNCTIMGVNKGEKGKAGELKGAFIKNKELAGDVSINSPFGVFGKLEQTYKNPLFKGEIETASADEVKIGKATILTTIDGNVPKEYDIEIVQKQYQKTPEQKGMVIKVTDERLLTYTGGIVQGMSGSPILQNGKLIGAVTHVFINDPTRGYGIYIDNMLDMADSVA